VPARDMSPVSRSIHRSKGKISAAGVVSVLLCLMLIYTTCTVFVQQAWALQSFQIGIYLLVAGYLLSGIRHGREMLAGGVAPWLVYLIPVWGVIQIVARTTASTFETRGEVLRWGALAGVFFLSQAVARSETGRRRFLSVFLGFATCLALLCIVQLYTSEGRVLWIFPTGYPDVYGTFPNANNFAQFIEVALPIALWRALRSGSRSWWYAVCGGVLYASVVASASRAGAVLCTVEILAFLVIGIVRLRAAKTGSRSRTTALTLLLVPVLAVVFTLAVGWQHVWNRFQGDDPYSGRREFLVAAVEMVKHRPLTGFGLGTYPEVCQRYAPVDFSFYVNHAHNDWAEFAADGGIPFLLLILIPFAAAIPTALRHPWGVGLIAVMTHACVDYPFPRPAVSGWMFALLGVLYLQRTSDRCNTTIDNFPAS